MYLYIHPRLAEQTCWLIQYILCHDIAVQFIMHSIAHLSTPWQFCLSCLWLQWQFALCPNWKSGPPPLLYCLPQDDWLSINKFFVISAVRQQTSTTVLH